MNRMDVVYAEKIESLKRDGFYYVKSKLDVSDWLAEEHMLYVDGFCNVEYDLVENKVIWKDFKKNKKDVSDVDYSELVVILRRYKFSNMCLKSDIFYIDSLIRRFGGDET